MIKGERHIFVSAKLLNTLNAYLRQTIPVMDTNKDAVLHTFTANFGDGWEADIKLCNGDGPYVDAVIFYNGIEMSCLEPCFDTIDGIYTFEPCDGVKFVVSIEQEANRVRP